MADLIQLAHKMRMEEIKAQTEMEKAKAMTVKTQVNIQDNSGSPFGQGNYGELIKKLIERPIMKTYVEKNAQLYEVRTTFKSYEISTTDERRKWQGERATNRDQETSHRLMPTGKKFLGKAK